MKIYYYLEESKLGGPVRVEEMKRKGLTKETLVWTEGMDDWKKIGNIPEIATKISAGEPEMVKNAGLKFISHLTISGIFIRFGRLYSRIRNFYLNTSVNLPQALRHTFARVLFRLARFINL
jgi:hypothetical protein